MFRVDNYGAFGGALEKFADIDRYVPELGDAPEDFNYDVMSEWDYEEWQNFVAEAELAKADADKDIQEWREKNEKYR